MLSQKALLLQIDSGHCRAICEEIGDRLRILLDKDACELPRHLQVLVDRLAELDGQQAPSIVPAMHDMIEWTDAA
jgi:ferritin-like protein